jgi:hypothetical protein
MEQLNYSKLLNLRKRFDKYDCKHSEEICALLDKQIAEEKAISKTKDNDRRLEYQCTMVWCDECNIELKRASLYIHRKTAKHIKNTK